MPNEDDTDPYEIPKKRGIFKVVPSGSLLTTHDIVERIIKNRLMFEERNKKKEKKEADCFAALERRKSEKPGENGS